jgi:hypothetical protein
MRVFVFGGAKGGKGEESHYGKHMKRSPLCIMFFVIVAGSGCAVPNISSQSLPSLSSSDFPSYGATAMTEKVTFGMAEGSGNEKITSNVLMTGGKESQRMSFVANTEWSRHFDNNKIINTYGTTTEGKIPETDDIKITFGTRSTHELTGKVLDLKFSSSEWVDAQGRKVEIKYGDNMGLHVSFKRGQIREDLRKYFTASDSLSEEYTIGLERLSALLKDKGPSMNSDDFSYFYDCQTALTKSSGIKDYQDIREKVSRWTEDEMRRVGKPVKTGDILGYYPVPLPKELPFKLKSEGVPEIVKGWGFYKGRRVLVTEYIVDEKVNVPEGLLSMRWKGYNLYDAEHFVALFRASGGFVNFDNPKEGHLSIQMNAVSEAYDVNVTNIVYSPQVQNSLSNTRLKKSNWNESSEKIKALGELRNKGLITQEEYDKKKAELLKDF